MRPVLFRRHPAVLRNVLREQYAAYPPLVHTQIDTLLNPKTFTVTTGHQLNIFGGPMYLIYKLVTVINLAKRLQQTYRSIILCRFTGWLLKTMILTRSIIFISSGRSTAGRRSKRRGRPDGSGELKTVFENIPEKLSFFEKAYLEHKTLADATRCWVNELFGDQGLLCVDADVPALKGQFQEVMHQDIFEGITRFSNG